MTDLIVAIIDIKTHVLKHGTANIGFFCTCYGIQSCFVRQ